MRILCPYCGERDAHEFSIRGEAPMTRPVVIGVPMAEAVAALHDRRNPPGRTREFWYHGAGCRSWLLVDRDLRTHEVFGATLASGAF
ncbi:MAG: sarcosine oxidase subunit delta [Bauldia sp.]|nr:sarcosine oxidase subunit delta [Bauldia sp.]